MSELTIPALIRRYLLTRGHRLPSPWTPLTAEPIFVALAEAIGIEPVHTLSQDRYLGALDQLADTRALSYDQVPTLVPLLEHLVDYLVEYDVMTINPHRPPASTVVPTRESVTGSCSNPTKDSSAAVTSPDDPNSNDWNKWQLAEGRFFSAREYGHRRLEGSTPAVYRGDLRQAAGYFREKHTDLTQEAVEAYVRWLELEAVNPRTGGRYEKSTVVRKKTALRSFLIFAQAKPLSYWTDVDVATLLKSKTRDKVAKHPHRSLSPADDKKYLSAAAGLLLADRLMVLLPRLGGLRAEDTGAFTWTAVDFANARLDYIAKKTGHRVQVPMTAELAALMSEYRNTCKDETYLFPGRTRSAVSGKIVAERVSRFAATAGIPRRVTPHDLRTTFATFQYYHEEVDLLVLQRWLGHSDINTTRGYVDADAGWERRRSVRDMVA